MTNLVRTISVLAIACVPLLLTTSFARSKEADPSRSQPKWAACKNVADRYISGRTPRTATPLRRHSALYVFPDASGRCGWVTANNRASAKDAREFGNSRCKEFARANSCFLIALDGKLIATNFEEFRLSATSASQKGNSTNPRSNDQLKLLPAPPSLAKPAETAVAPASRSTANIPSSTGAELQQVSANLGKQIELLQTLLEEQRLEKSKSGNAGHIASLTIDIILRKMDDLREKKTSQNTQTSTYQTPVRPDNGQSSPTARRISESYPPIPYYIAGSREIGEFWVLPEVSDIGKLEFKVRFMDPGSANDNIRSQVSLSLPEIEQMADSLAKLHEWSEIARKTKLRKEYQKRVICFPVENCPVDDIRIEGKSSTELIFHVNEEGFTNGAIQRNKGTFVESYNVSIPSGLMLRCYMMHVMTAAKAEYLAGTQTKKDLDDGYK